MLIHSFILNFVLHIANTFLCQLFNQELPIYERGVTREDYFFNIIIPGDELQLIHLLRDKDRFLKEVKYLSGMTFKDLRHHIKHHFCDGKVVKALKKCHHKLKAFR